MINLKKKIFKGKGLKDKQIFYIYRLKGKGIFSIHLNLETSTINTLLRAAVSKFTLMYLALCQEMIRATQGNAART